MKKIIFSLFLFTTCIIPHHFVLMSAPGSGKGTFSQYMMHKYDYIQICPGDLFRQEILEQTEFGKQIQPIVESGQYVAEDIVYSIIRHHIEKTLNMGKKFILDGYPRSEIALQFLMDLFTELQINGEVTFVQFVASDEMCVERILGRMVCNKCHKVYHKSHFATEPFICSDCSIELDVRKADQKEIIGKRLIHFHEIVEPLLLKVMDKYPVIKIDSEQSLHILERLYDEIV